MFGLVFDRVADVRSINCLGIVDDATDECVALAPGRLISGTRLPPLLAELALTRGLATVTRSNNGPEFIGKAMLKWALADGVQLKQNESGKPNQNARIESFNGRFRDACLNEHWLVSLAHATVIIQGWHHEYNEERPKEELSALTPPDYATRMAARTAM